MRPAISLTLDDGLPCQIEHALPILDRCGLAATFFLIVNSPYDTEFRTEVWKEAVKRGHEIGSHSVNHRKAADMARAEAYAEAADSQKFLQEHVEAPVTSFCYPFTDAPAHVQDPARALYKQARGGRGARADKYLKKGDGANLYNVPSFHIGPETFKELPGIIRATIEQKAWVTLMLHGVGPDHTQWENITSEQFSELCHMLLAAEAGGLQVAPFGIAAGEYRCKTS